MIMNADSLLFFDKHMDAVPLYEALENRILKEIENVQIKVQKSQISFYNKHLFACVSGFEGYPGEGLENQKREIIEES